MTLQFDTEQMLARLAAIRRSLPPETLRPRRKTAERLEAASVEDFETAAVTDALESVADDVASVVQNAHDSLFEQALDVYYATETLAADPANAHLIEHVENMRRAYEESYGHPIPTREATLARRTTGAPPAGRHGRQR